MRYEINKQIDKWTPFRSLCSKLSAGLSLHPSLIPIADSISGSAFSSYRQPVKRIQKYTFCVLRLTVIAA